MQVKKLGSPSGAAIPVQEICKTVSIMVPYSVVIIITTKVIIIGFYINISLDALTAVFANLNQSHTIKMSRHEYPAVPGAFQVDGVLSVEECNQLRGIVKDLRVQDDTIYRARLTETTGESCDDVVSNKRRNSQLNVPCHIPDSAMRTVIGRLQPFLPTTGGTGRHRFCLC